MPLLETRNLDIGYSPGIPLQQGLNFQIEKGQIISLMGQNGVGKTTFLKTLHGLIAPLRGEVLIKNRPLSGLSRVEIAKSFSLVLTEKPPFKNLSVRELVGLGRHPHSNWLGILSTKDREAVDDAIDLTKINYLTKKRLYELSDGQYQKVMVARALAQQTDLIVLDEPVAHLDLNNKIEVMLLLRQLAEQKKGILISTHDLQITTQLSDELWLFNFNERAQKGLPEDLIVQGKLEKALYLKEHPYDIIHQRILHRPEGRAVSLSGEENIVFWTAQALNRAGFQVGESDINIRCHSHHWTHHSSQYQSIKDLIDDLKNPLFQREPKAG